jgi:hypothetical protein
MDPVSITDALDHKYENARHNVYYPANANKLPTRFSARTKLPANQPTSIYPSYKCKLSLYSLLYRIEPAKIIARYDKQSDTCAKTGTKKIQSFMWRCGLK